MVNVTDESLVKKAKRILIFLSNLVSTSNKSCDQKYINSVSLISFIRRKYVWFAIDKHVYRKNCFRIKLCSIHCWNYSPDNLKLWSNSKKCLSIVLTSLDLAIILQRTFYLLIYMNKVLICYKYIKINMRKTLKLWHLNGKRKRKDL